MKYRVGLILVGTILLVVGSACSKKSSREEIVITIPPGFNGNFVLEMGVKNAPELNKDGNEYTVSVPKDGRVLTSTLLSNPQVSFKNESDGAVWGYSHLGYSTGDGIAVGGKIEFFVGTKKDFDAQENKKHHSGDFLGSETLTAVL